MSEHISTADGQTFTLTPSDASGEQVIVSISRETAQQLASEINILIAVTEERHIVYDEV